MIALLVALLSCAPVSQASKDARVMVTVVDQTGAVIPNAKVTVTPVPDSGAAIAPVMTNDKGVATLTALAPGRYSIAAEFPGFEPRILKDVQVKAGDNKHVAVLAIQGLQDSVTVSRDAREAASDRRATVRPAVKPTHVDSLAGRPHQHSPPPQHTSRR